MKQYLKENGFSPINEDSKFRKYIEELGSDDVYLNQLENEMYLVKGKDEPVSMQEVQSYVDKIAGFTLLFPNLALSYNVNLVFICPLKKQQIKDGFLNQSNRLIIERDKYYCRKFIINSSAKNLDEELDILPIRPVSLHIKEQFSGYDGLNQSVSKVIGDSIFEELSKKEKPDLDAFLKLIEIE
ncbi:MULTISPECIES: ABC-three component system middle component 1 [unclassified Paenibacillus]|uniref:ABC-three component system middle component 1 n=1 Tax=unclassified Paenibacillus TaxID=185978 RepID=UPI0024054C50|nr:MULTISPECIES: ABC-three component system middle component 1 [unclassified Paenibacillus]